MKRRHSRGVGGSRSARPRRSLACVFSGARRSAARPRISAREQRICKLAASIAAATAVHASKSPQCTHAATPGWPGPAHAGQDRAHLCPERVCCRLICAPASAALAIHCRRRKRKPAGRALQWRCSRARSAAKGKSHQAAGWLLRAGDEAPFSRAFFRPARTSMRRNCRRENMPALYTHHAWLRLASKIDFWRVRYTSFFSANGLVT